MPPAPPVIPVKAPPAHINASANNATRLNQANTLGLAQHEEHYDDQNFGFSVIRRTATQILSPLTYGTIGASFFAGMLSVAAALGNSGTVIGEAIGKIGAQIANFAPLNNATSIIKPITDKVGETVGHEFTATAAGTLLVPALVFGAIGVGAALTANALNLQMECEARAREKCKQKAPQVEQPKQAPQIVIVPVGVEVSQHAHAHQLNDQENTQNVDANAAADSVAHTALVKKKFNPGELAKAIEAMRHEQAAQVPQIG